MDSHIIQEMSALSQNPPQKPACLDEVPDSIDSQLPTTTCETYEKLKNYTFVLERQIPVHDLNRRFIDTVKEKLGEMMKLIL